jgi:hypothetical protein
MSTNERSWESLSAVWQTSREAVGGEPLRRLLRSYRRRVAAVAVGEILLIAAFAWLSWAVVRDGVVLWEAVWLWTLWIFTAVAAPFAWWNRRGAWQSMVETVAEFQRLRAVRRLRSLRFGCGLFVAEVVVVVAELAWFGRFGATAALSLAALAVAFGIWAVWMTRRAAAEMAAAAEEDEPGPPDGRGPG